jgi:hypothetical protein
MPILKNKCSILSKSKNKSVSCMTNKEIVKLVKTYNKMCNFDQKTSLNKLDMITNLKASLGVVDERNIKKVEGNLYKLVEKRSDNWLTTNELNTLMKQVSIDLFEPKKIKFLGVFPSDISGSSHGRSILKLKDNTSPVSMIVNTDPGNKPGQHWVSIFYNPKEKFIRYFDSNGEKYNKNIQKILEFYKVPIKIENTKPLQQSEGLCGMYSVGYLIKRAKSKSLSKVTAQKGGKSTVSGNVRGLQDKEIIKLKKLFIM